MEKTYLVIPGCTDFNRGDQALVWETVRLAKEAGLEGKYYMMSDSPQETEQSMKEGLEVFSPILRHPGRNDNEVSNIKYGFRLKLRWGLKAFSDFLVSWLLLFVVSRVFMKPLLPRVTRMSLKLFEKAEACFVKGGGFLHSYGGLTGTYYTYYMLYHIRLAQKLGKPVFVMPNSFGPFEGPLVKSMLKKVIKKCAFASTRESISASAVKEQLGIDIPVYPDLGFYLLKANQKEAFEYLKARKVPVGQRKVIAITMRPYRFPRSSDPEIAYSRYKEAFAEFIKFVSSQGFHVLLVEHTISESKHESDASCISDMIPLIGQASYTYISDRSLDCRKLKSIYSVCDFTVGTRFHSVIFSMSENIPSIAVTYGGNKGDGIMRDMCFSKYAVQINSVSAEELNTKLRSLVENSQSVKEKLSEQSGDLSRKRRELIRELGIAFSETKIISKS